MRIIGGKNRRRNILPPTNFRARPTTDFAKENLFNILANYFDFEELQVLDLFSGTGSISYEFCSRGAQRVVSVEINPVHHKFISQMGRELGYDQLHAIKSNAFVYIKSIHDTFDIVFADPPYDMEGITELPQQIISHGLVKAEGWLILEHSCELDFTSHPNFREQRQYGSVHFSIFNNL